MNVLSLATWVWYTRTKAPQSAGKVGQFITQFWDKWEGLLSFPPNIQEGDLGYIDNNIPFPTSQVVINTNQKLFF